MDLARQWHHIAFMTGKKPRPQKHSAQHTRALARWEGEGGAPPPESDINRETRAALAREEGTLRRCPPTAPLPLFLNAVGKAGQQIRRSAAARERASACPLSRMQ